MLTYLLTHPGAAPYSDQVKREELARVYEVYDRSVPLGQPSLPHHRVGSAAGIGVFRGSGDRRGGWGG